MSYRDEDGAKVARIDALEDEVEALREENEKLKAGAAPTKPEPAPSKEDRKRLKKQAAERIVKTVDTAPSPPTGWEQRSKRDGLTYALGSILGAIVVCGLGVALPSIFGQKGTPDSAGLGVMGMIGILVGGGSVPSTALRILLPAVPITAKDENGTYTVERSMKMRRVLFALSSAAYIAGVALWWLAMTKR